MDIPIEYDLRPAYYDDFHCLAGDCRMTCCQGWRVTFDRADYMRIKRVKGSPELNARMAHVLHRIRSGPLSEKFFGEFRMNEEDGRCPLQSEEGLCLLQMEKGHETLPLICKAFPRTQSACLSGYFERALDPGCEGVLSLLWDLPEGVDFRSDPLPQAGAMQFTPNRSGVLLERFQDIRSQCIDILQDRRMPLPERMMLLGMALKKLADGERELERWMTYVRLCSEQAAAEGIPLLTDQRQSRAQFLINSVRMLRMFSKEKIAQELLSALDSELDGGKRGTISVEPYLEARARYAERFAGREYFLENLMVSVFFKMRLPLLDSADNLWRSYTAFCNLYSFYRFLAVMSCREGAPGDRAELFRMIVFGSREMLHGDKVNDAVVNVLFRNNSATLAHMAILLGS